MLPLPMQDSLPAGWLAFTGWELNPLGRNERFPRCYIFFPFPGFILTLREFIVLLVGAAVTWPLSAPAQHTKMHRVAFVASTSPVSEFTGADPINPAVRAFVHGL